MPHILVAYLTRTYFCNSVRFTSSVELKHTKPHYSNVQCLMDCVGFLFFTMAANRFKATSVALL